MQRRQAARASGRHRRSTESHRHRQQQQHGNAAGAQKLRRHQAVGLIRSAQNAKQARAPPSAARRPAANRKLSHWRAPPNALDEQGLLLASCSATGCVTSRRWIDETAVSSGPAGKRARQQGGHGAERFAHRPWRRCSRRCTNPGRNGRRGWSARQATSIRRRRTGAES